MKIKVYAIGEPIKTAEYASWMHANLIAVTATPRIKPQIDTKTLLNSIVACNVVTYFPTEEEAINQARTQAISHRIDPIYTECPAIFEVLLESNNERFVCVELISAKILNKTGIQQEEQLNYLLEANSFSSWSFFGYLAPKAMICGPQNYQGDFGRLLSPLANFTFLCGNSRGFTPSHQENTYQLPEEMTKKISEYVLGHALK